MDLLPPLASPAGLSTGLASVLPAGDPRGPWARRFVAAARAASGRMSLGGYCVATAIAGGERGSTGAGE
jgi:hypothetical protein